MKEIYFDNAATTMVYEEVADKMKEIMICDYGNPSSLHLKGMQGEKYIKEAKDILAKLLKVKEKEIFFTSGGTESNNWALIGGARGGKRRGKHIITTVIEHPAVYNVTGFLEEEGFETTYLPVNEQGEVEIQTLKDALREDTILVSIMQVNNEIGTRQPIEELVKVVKNFNPQILFHVDGIQGFGKEVFYPGKTGVDLYSISGHKFHGPKGVGLLYIKEKTKMMPLIFGGGQQKGMRSGTENVPGIAGLAEAAKISYDNHDEKKAYLRELQDYFVEGVRKIEGVTIHGELAKMRAPHIVSVGVEGIKSEVLLHALEEKHIYVSSGSACASNHPSISGVLKGIQAPKEYLDTTVRFSFSRFNTKSEIDCALETLYNIVPMFRKYRRR